MKILVCCANGISTSILKEKISRLGGDDQINSVSIGDLKMLLSSEKYDIILVAPQMAHRKTFFDRIASDYHIPWLLIDGVSYGRMDVAAILNQAKEFMAGN